MTSHEKGNWIRRIFTLFLILIAAGAGVYFAMAGGGGAAGEKKKAGLQLTKENEAEILASPNKLTVINIVVGDSQDSEKLREALKKLDEEKYDDRVVVAELDVEDEPEIAKRHGVKTAGFTGQLDFYANGKKLDQLIGHTDPAAVEKTIDRLLAGLLMRVSKDWLPQVPGMQRVKGQDNLKIQPAEAAKPSPKP